MGLVLCIAAFLGVLLLVRRTLGHGLGVLLVIGSVYGLVRCRIFDGFSHFLFDAATLGAYLGAAPRLKGKLAQWQPLRNWILVLGILPLALILVSPLLDAQPVLIQFLGLRPALYFLPFLVLGAIAEPKDWTHLGMWASIVAIGTALVAAGEYVWGIEAFFPMNDASNIIYISQDVGETLAYRIPSTFGSSHGYGGTMVAILPLLLLGVEARGWRRVLAIAAIPSAVLGVFACGARTPVILLGAVLLAVFARGFRRPGLRAAAVVAAVLALIVVPREKRFQRFETLSDSEYVSGRVANSVNTSLLDTIIDSPMGRGLGSAAGTSIPYFLAAEARPQVGLENEYARIAVEQGVVGLVLWIAFGLWVLLRNPFELQSLGGVAESGFWAVCVTSWMSGAIGTGFLASIPGTMLLMLYMGVLATSERFKGAQPVNYLSHATFGSRQSA